MGKEIYLDWAATSYKKPKEVPEAVAGFFKDICVSSGRGAYKRAFLADNLVYECRKEAARLFNVSDPARIVLTSGATESINLALKGYLKEGDHVVTTSLEHNAVIRTLHRLKEERGISYTIVRCDENGYFDLDELKNSITKNTTLLAINHASNVIGTLLPVADISRIAKEHGIKVLLDVAQSAGAIEVDLKKLDVDFLAFAGHKSLLGPQGTGGLYVKDGITLNPLKEGGTGSDSKSLTMPENLPERFEAGTLNYPGIAGLKEGIKYLNGIGIDEIRRTELEMISHALFRFSELEKVTLYSCKKAADMVGVFAFNMEGYEPSELAHILDTKYGIMVRSGLHCAPLAHESIGTIETGAVRASIGYATKRDEIDALFTALKELYAR
jgi:cysteine desulfurase family protein